MRKVATIILAIAMISALALGASARTDVGPSWIENGAPDSDGFTILTNGTDGVENDLTTEMLAGAKYLIIECNPDEDFETGMGFIWGAHLGGWWNQNDIEFADYYANGALVLPLADLNNYDDFVSNSGHVLDDGEPGALKLMVRIWGAWDEINAGAIYLADAPPAAAAPAVEEVVPVEVPEVADSGIVAITTPIVATGTPQKDGADTGIADVAVASAIALVAAGAVMFSRKKK